MNDLFQATMPADLFNEFWAAYPRKVGKGQARKAYAKALRIASHDDIMFGLSQQRPSMEAKEPQFIPHASTWLNGERWDDEPEPTCQTGTNQGRTSQLDEIRARALAAAGLGQEQGDIGS